MIAELKENEAFMSMALPHELVHALQDQAHRAFDPARPVGAPGYKPAAQPERRSRMLPPDLGRVYFHPFGRPASPD